MKQQLLLRKKSFLAVSFVMVFLWFSYTHPAINRNADKDQEIASRQKEKSAGTRDSFPIDYIIRNSRPRAIYYNLRTINYPKLKPVGSVFFRKWFEQIPVKISVYDQVAISSTSSNSYYFFDHMDLDSVFLFTIFEHQHDLSVFRLYHFTVSKKYRKIVHADWIAAQGGTNRYMVNEQLVFNPKGTHLRVNSSVYTSYRFHQYREISQTTFQFGLKKTHRKMATVRRFPG